MSLSPEELRTGSSIGGWPRPQQPLQPAEADVCMLWCSTAGDRARTCHGAYLCRSAQIDRNGQILNVFTSRLRGQTVVFALSKSKHFTKMGGSSILQSYWTKYTQQNTRRNIISVEFDGIYMVQIPLKTLWFFLLLWPSLGVRTIHCCVWLAARSLAGCSCQQ